MAKEQRKRETALRVQAPEAVRSAVAIAKGIDALAVERSERPSVDAFGLPILSTDLIVIQRELDRFQAALGPSRQIAVPQSRAFSPSVPQWDAAVADAVQGIGPDAGYALFSAYCAMGEQATEDGKVIPRYSNFVFGGLLPKTMEVIAGHAIASGKAAFIHVEGPKFSDGEPGHEL